MSQADGLIRSLMDRKDGELSRLRRLAGQPLDADQLGFDLFTGLWWPLRATNQRAPRREPSWLAAKLYGAVRVPHVRPDDRGGPSLPAVLGLCEPRDEHAQPRFRARFERLLCAALPALEPHLRWALQEVRRAVDGRVPWAAGVRGIDWAGLVDDLSIWDRDEQHRRGRDIRDIWAEQYLATAERRSLRPQQGVCDVD